jgi:hypothetical protein
MRDLVTRAIRARPELTAELLRRGALTHQERAELLHACPEYASKARLSKLGPMMFATLLAEADTQLAARAVLRDVAGREALGWLDRLLRFRKPNGKRDELIRIVERALEGRNVDARKRR